jgi:hypothetical protein
MLTSMLLLLLLVVSGVPAVGRVQDFVLDFAAASALLFPMSLLLAFSMTPLSSVTSIMKQKLYRNIKIAPRKYVPGKENIEYRKHLKSSRL